MQHHKHILANVSQIFPLKIAILQFYLIADLVFKKMFLLKNESQLFVIENVESEKSCGILKFI